MPRSAVRVSTGAAAASVTRSPAGMARNFWDPSEGLYGMFNLWSFRGIDALVSSGLGGGSLIYANVMIRKDGLIEASTLTLRDITVEPGGGLSGPFRVGHRR